DKLIKDSYVLETEKQKTKGGKRPTLLKINENKGFVIGIDLGRKKIRAALNNFSGKMTKKYWGFEVVDKKDIGERLNSEISKILSRNKKSGLKSIEPELKAICIGVPAVIDVDSGKIISAPLYGSWRDLNLKEIISNKFNIPVFIDNNVNLTALTEKNYGEGKNFSDVVFVEISNGIGAGIIIDNHLLRGSYGSAGEIGFTIINSENLGFKIKNKGFLEKFASVKSIQKKAIEAINKGRKTLIMDIVENDISKIEPSIVCKAAINGDRLANDIIEGIVRFLSIIIINLVLILNPQIIILGGDICSLPEVDKLFVKPIISLVEESVPFKIPYIKLSSLGEDAGVIGASFMAMEALLIDEFPYKIEQEVLT
ncbi:unnamed protein product, partial [marine sediment metagenome]